MQNVHAIQADGSGNGEIQLCHGLQHSVMGGAVVDMRNIQGTVLIQCSLLQQLIHQLPHLVDIHMLGMGTFDPTEGTFTDKEVDMILPQRFQRLREIGAAVQPVKERSAVGQF